VIRTSISRGSYRTAKIYGVHVVQLGAQAVLRGYMYGRLIESPRMTWEKAQGLLHKYNSLKEV